MNEIVFWLEELTKPNTAEQAMLVLSIISISISSITLIFAILIPVRIANKQAKIDLFEKRYEIYTEFIAPINNIFSAVEYFEDMEEANLFDYILKAYNSLDDGLMKEVIEDYAEKIITNETDDDALKTNILLDNKIDKATILFIKINRNDLKESLVDLLKIFATALAFDRYKEKAELESQEDTEGDEQIIEDFNLLEEKFIDEFKIETAEKDKTKEKIILEKFNSIVTKLDKELNKMEKQLNL